MTKDKRSGIAKQALLEMFDHEIDTLLAHDAKDPNAVDQSVRLTIANQLFWEFHGRELNAVLAADEGDPTELQELLQSQGILQTEYGREFVADRIAGTKKTPGQKRTRGQIGKEVQLAIRIADIMHQENCDQAKAIEVYMDENPEVSTSSSTVRTYFNRGKDEFLKLAEVYDWTLGPKLSNAFRKARNSETD